MNSKHEPHQMQQRTNGSIKSDCITIETLSRTIRTKRYQVPVHFTENSYCQGCEANAGQYLQAKHNNYLKPSHNMISIIIDQERYRPIVYFLFDITMHLGQLLECIEVGYCYVKFTGFYFTWLHLFRSIYSENDPLTCYNKERD